MDRRLGKISRVKTVCSEFDVFVVVPVSPRWGSHCRKATFPGEKSGVDKTDCALRLQALHAMGGCEPMAERALPERALKRIPAVSIKPSYSAGKEHFSIVGRVTSWTSSWFSSPHSFIQRCNLTEEEAGMPWQSQSLLPPGALVKKGLIAWLPSWQGIIQAYVPPVLCLSPRKGAIFTGRVFVAWICFSDISVSHAILWGFDHK